MNKQKTKQQKELKALLQELYIEGELFLREIAGQFGICPETVRKWLKKFDIPRRKARYKHGVSKSRLHQIWKDMKQRCLNPKNSRYLRYGGRGIRIFLRWIDDFVAFRKFAFANGYADNLTIDRIENDKGYFPDNVQFITRSENSRKKGDKE
jgi:transposase